MKILKFLKLRKWRLDCEFWELVLAEQRRTFAGDDATPGTREGNQETQQNTREKHCFAKGDTEQRLVIQHIIATNLMLTETVPKASSE